MNHYYPVSPPELNLENLKQFDVVYKIWREKKAVITEQPWRCTQNIAGSNTYKLTTEIETRYVSSKELVRDYIREEDLKILHPEWFI